MSARPQWISPSLTARSDGTVPAYEMKFAVPVTVAATIEEWAGRNMSLDPHADPELGNRYRITSVYYDTPEFDVFHRRPGFDVHKYRVRRYGTEPTVHLERKSKQDGRVWKCRATMPLPYLARPTTEWPAPWFVQEMADRHMQPVCAVTYDRAAFVGTSATGPIRVTLDRAAVGAPMTALTLDPISTGVPLLTDEVVIEFKYLTAVPPAFKGILESEKLTPTGLSKYRRCVRASGLASAPEYDTPLLDG